MVALARTMEKLNAGLEMQVRLPENAPQSMHKAFTLS
jgi:hypothetical protein